MEAQAKEFKDLTTEEKEQLEAALKRRDQKNGRGLLWDVRCVWIEEQSE